MEKRNLFISVILILVLGIGFGVYVYNNETKNSNLSASQAQSQTQPNNIMKKIQEAEMKILEQFFDDQKKGRESIKLFCYESNATTFFALKNWEIVDGKESFGNYTIRVDSSTKAGLAITKLWEFRLLTEIDASKSCISSINEKQ